MPRSSVRIARLSARAFALLLLVAPPAFGQSGTLPVDSLLSAHAYEVRIDDGRLVGEGAELLFLAARSAQFVGILEEHNVAQLARFSQALFTDLHRREGFDYMAVEQGSVITRWLNEPELRGDLEAVSRLVARFPHALTFATDEEIEMIVGVGRESDAGHRPVWGVDQELGALHILERLHELATSPAARREVEPLMAQARRYESDRSGDTLYLSQVARPESFSELPTLFQASGEEARMLVDALQRTVRIYHNWYRSAVLGEATGYENGRERELSMKQRFMEEYRQARALDGGLPRVVAKLGHWHLFRGIYRANVPTFGNFLSELARANGMDTFFLSTYVLDSPDPWRRGVSGPLASAATESVFTVVDLRPLRALAHAGRIADLSDGMEEILYRADAALIIRGGATGSYTLTGGE